MIMTIDHRGQQRLNHGASSDNLHQTLRGLEEVEAHIRHIQQLVLEDAPCCEILRESAIAQAELARCERARLVNELEQRLLRLRRCTAEAAPTLTPTACARSTSGPITKGFDEVACAGSRDLKLWRKTCTKQRSHYGEEETTCIPAPTE